MKYLLFVIPLMFFGCESRSNSAALCKELGYKGVVSEATYQSYHSSQLCSNGELVNGNFLTSAGAIAETYSIKGSTYTRIYIEFK